MQRAIRTTIGLVGALLLVLSAAPAASAAPPSNDTFTGETVVIPGFGDTLDTTEATTDADDAELNGACGFTATDASVWYAIDGTEHGLEIDVSGSDYPAGVIVATGIPGSFSVELCVTGSVGFSTSVGTTYHVMVFDDQTDGGGNGGSLTIAFRATPPPPPPPTMAISVDPVARVNARTGEVRLSGTLTCTDADFVFVDGQLTQETTRFRIEAGFGTGGGEDPCDGTARAWTATADPFAGKFVGGRATVLAFGFACGFADCAVAEFEGTVRLKGAH